MRTPESPPRFSEEEDRGSRRWQNHWSLRKTSKDLREYALQSDPTFPNRARLLQLTEELLSIVAPTSQKSEKLDERRRKIDRGELDPYSEED